MLSLTGPLEGQFALKSPSHQNVWKLKFLTKNAKGYNDGDGSKLTFFETSSRFFQLAKLQDEFSYCQILILKLVVGCLSPP